MNFLFVLRSFLCDLCVLRGKTSFLSDSSMLRIRSLATLRASPALLVEATRAQNGGMLELGGTCLIGCNAAFLDEALR
jgi:hypothetical protein